MEERVGTDEEQVVTRLRKPMMVRQYEKGCVRGKRREKKDLPERNPQPPTHSTHGDGLISWKPDPVYIK